MNEQHLKRETMQLAVVRGEGIGPSVIDSAISVLEAAADLSGISLRCTYSEEFDGFDGGAKEFFQDAFNAGMPVMSGACGGRFVYELRKEFELAYKFTPLVPEPALFDAGIVRPERLSDVDILMVRDNLAGLYQGDFVQQGNFESASQTASYSKADVIRLLEVSKSAAASRKGKLTVVFKPGGVPAISELWRLAALEVVQKDLELNFLEVDNAAYQLVADPKSFDVVVAPNMFGDILGDTGSLLLGSRGMSYSANFSHGGHSVYQTAHGAAHDLAGKNVANPVGQILSTAWLIEREFGQAKLAQMIRKATTTVFAEGYRTADVAGKDSEVVGTTEITHRIIDVLNSVTNG